jgi:hypothetical protein
VTHEIQDDRSAPGLLLAALNRCVLLIVVFLVCMPAGARSETIVSHGATPAGNALSLIANGRATPGLLSEQIVEAA